MNEQQFIAQLLQTFGAWGLALFFVWKRLDRDLKERRHDERVRERESAERESALVAELRTHNALLAALEERTRRRYGGAPLRTRTSPFGVQLGQHQDSGIQVRRRLPNDTDEEEDSDADADIVTKEK